MSQPEVAVFPIAAWDTHTLPERNLMLTLRFLATPFDTLAMAQFRNFGMTASQARALASDLLKGAEAAEKRTGRMPGPQH